MRLLQKGVTLVELMISLLLGSLLMAALLSLFLTERQIASQIESTASLSERAGFIAGFLSRHLREAGYAPAEMTAPDPVRFTGALASSDHPLADTLVIFSEGGHGCTDEVLENNEGVEWRRFSLYSDGDRRELRCEDSQGGPYPMLDGVEALQVQYGVDGNLDRVPDFYVRATDVPAGARLVSLRVGVLLRCDAVLGRDNAVGQEPLPLLDVQLPADPVHGVDFADGRLRRRVVLTIALRNVQ